MTFRVEIKCIFFFFAMRKKIIIMKEKEHSQLSHLPL